MSEVANLNSYRAKARSVPVEKMDKMIAMQMQSCGMQLDMMGKYFGMTSRPEIAQALDKIARGVSSLAAISEGGWDAAG